ncbi:putative surface protein bspA-like [Solea solea]|uniref:putative surface protein bspA-like n=1 Tax=Solea solea TaxID=90069 RepID=UPI00272CB66D|nr:putative surface protein bspA-like [Solea solea]
MKLICIAVILFLCAGTTLKPTAAATVTGPVDPSEQPSGPTSNPVDPSEQPSGPTSNPVDPSEQPSGPTSNPVDPSEQPSGQTTGPVDPSEQPSGQTTNNPAPTEAQTTSPGPVEEGDQGLSPGEIAGVVIGSVAGVALIGGGIFGILKYTGKI